MLFQIRKVLGDKTVPRRYDQIYKTIKTIKPLKIMEVGVWTGSKAQKMIKVASRYHDVVDVEYFGFDLFEDLSDSSYIQEVSKKPLAYNEVSERLKLTNARITLIRGNTLESIQKNLTVLPKMDFIFIDGGHSLETIQSDWENVSQLMHDETVVIFDDYWLNRSDAGAKKIVDAIDRGNYKVEIMPILDVFNNTDFGILEIKLAKVTKK